MAGTVNQYIVSDESTSDKWAITVSNGQLLISSTTDSASDNPEFLDSSDNVTYWTLTVNNGEINLENIGDSDDTIKLRDQATGGAWQLKVDSGQLYITSVVVGGPAITIHIKVDSIRYNVYISGRYYLSSPPSPNKIYCPSRYYAKHKRDFFKVYIQSRYYMKARGTERVMVYMEG